MMTRKQTDDNIAAQEDYWDTVLASPNYHAALLSILDHVNARDHFTDDEVIAIVKTIAEAALSAADKDSRP